MIYMVTDTNYWFSSPSKRTPSFSDMTAWDTDKLKKLIDLKEKRCIDNVSVLIPEIVLDERIQQCSEEYSEKSETFIELAAAFSTSLPGIPSMEDYKKDLRERSVDLLHKNGIDIIPVCSSDRM